MMRYTLILLSFVVVLLLALSEALESKPPLSSDPVRPIPPTEQQTIEQNLAQLPLYFIENQGQLDEQVAYYIQGRDTSVYFTATGVTFAQTTPMIEQNPAEEGFYQANPIDWVANGTNRAAQRWSVKLDFVGANPEVRPIGETQTEAVISYFKGKPEEWHAGLPTYRRIAYPDLWPGIDLVYEGTTSQLKYTFVVQPGADPAQIRLAYRGATDLVVNASGQMDVKTPLGGFVDDAPVAYQVIAEERVAVEMAYILDVAIANSPWSFYTNKQNADSEIHSFGFHIGDYDPSLPLILDPAVLLYAGYIGGSGIDRGNSISIDESGNAYITGQTNSSEASFPVLVGPDLSFNGAWDIFAIKVSNDGTSLIYAGYIGGTAVDVGEDIFIDELGNSYIVGETQSYDFPVLVGPDLTYNSSIGCVGYCPDAFVIKLNNSGTSLVYAGFIGGWDWDSGQSIAVDNGGNAYITGYTGSDETSFPVFIGPDLTYNGYQFDAFVAKVSTDGASLDYSGYIGGSSLDMGYGIAVDGSGNTYITGHTSSSEASFPVAGGPDLTFNGDGDAFVAKVSTDGAFLVYTGYIGGSGNDFGQGIAVDELGNTYITGYTSSSETSFPVLGGPDLTFNGANGASDAFVTKVTSNGASFVYSGYIGGSGSDSGADIAVDASGSIYITGYTTSSETSFPVLQGPDLTFNGNGDAFVAKVGNNGASLVYAGYIGGSNIDLGQSIAVNGADNVFVTGTTYSTEASFPVWGGLDLTFNGNEDAFVVKVVVDDISPSSSASSPTYATIEPISISWGANDDLSGVSTTALWVKFGSGGTWADSGLSQSGTSGTFSFTPASGDGTYYFATVAIDRAGNVEASPISSGDDSTIYDTVAPGSNASSPDYTITPPVTVSWNASDATSGVNSTALWVKFGSIGNWIDSGLSQSGTSGSFIYVPTNGDGPYYFATVATDNAGNIEATPTDSGDDMTVYNNLPPIANGDSFTTDEDTPVTTGNVLDNDSNTGEDPISLIGADASATIGLVVNNGDGTFVYDPNAQFNYLPIGDTATDAFLYTIADSYGVTATATVLITITGVNDAPLATAGGPYSLNEGSSISLEGMGSDPDGDALTYEWDFDYDGITFDVDATGPTPSYSGVDGPFTYTVALRVSDGGSSVVDTTNLTVANVAPIVNAGSSQVVSEGEDLVLEPATFNDPGVQDTHTATVDWGDGTIEPGVVNAGTVSGTHVYVEDGVYPVMVCVNDDDGGSGCDGFVAIVNNAAPSLANLVATPLITETGQVTVTGSLIDPGTLDSLTLVVDWADGITETLNYTAGSSSFLLNHIYEDDALIQRALSGDFIILLTLTDDDGGQDNGSVTVTVNNAAPQLTNLAIAPVVENEVATLSGTIVEINPADSFSLTVDWGDGHIDVFAYPAGATGFTETHQYLDDNYPADGFPVVLTLVDDDGGADVRLVTAVVQNVPPAVNAGPDRTTQIGWLVDFIGNFTDPGTLDTHTIFWDFGDGHSATGILLPTHIYITPGTFQVTLTVADDDDGISQDTLIVTVLHTIFIPILVASN